MAGARGGAQGRLDPVETIGGLLLLAWLKLLGFRAFKGFRVKDL